MRIVRLDLLAFGPFTQETLDFSDCASDLHIVYGPNEAGKSSALRALRNWLYGIPPRTADNFVHSYQNLRIGGVLETADGTRLEFIRRKGRANTLRGPDDAEVIDEARLHGMLGGIDETTFAQRFGIDYQELRRGGEAVIRGGGDLAQVLFAAGAGVADLRAIQQRLEEECEALFKARGSSQAIPKAISELKKAREAIRQLQLPTSQWAKHDEALRKAQKRQREIDKELSEKRAERNRLDRVSRSLLLISQLKQLREDLTSVADAPLLPETFSADRREAETNLSNAKQNKRTAEQEIERLTKQLAEVEVPQHLLEHRTAITDLHTELGSYRKAAKDRPNLVDRRDHAQQQAGEILKQLGRPARLDEIDSLKLPSPQRRRIQELAGEWKALVEKQRSSEQAVRELEREIQRIENEIEELPPLRDVSELERVIRRTQKQGDLDEQRRAAEDELRQLREQAEIQLEQLPLFEGTLEKLVKLQVPLIETIDRFEDALAEAERNVCRLEERIEELTAERQDLQNRLDALCLEQDVPTEEDLERARERRDAGWQLVRQAWQAGSPGSDADSGEPAVTAFIDEFAPAGDLAAAYHLSVEAADQIADRLRREADRVARKAQLTADLNETEQKLGQLRSELQEARQRCLAEQEAWQSQWTALGIEPLSPREMRSWRDRQQELGRLATEIRRRESDVNRLSEQIASYRADLLDVLAELDLNTTSRAADEPLSTTIERCQEHIEAIRRQNQERETKTQRHQELKQQLPEVQRAADNARQEFENWKKQWTEAVAPLGLRADTKPAKANAVIETVDKLVNLTNQIRELNERITGIDSDAEKYEQRVRRLLEQIAEDLLDTPTISVKQAVADLADRLRHAEKDEERVRAWQEQLEKQQAAKREAERQIEHWNEVLDTLCQQAGCASPEELLRAEEQSKKRRELESELKGVQQRLTELAAGTELEKWITTVEQFDSDQVQADLRTLDDKVESLEEEKKRVSEEIGEHRNELSRMDGSDRAAEAQIQAEYLLAAIRRDAERYIRLRLASEVLWRAMERFRKASQGPVLARAGELFSELTLGSFGSLRADFDDRGKPVLVGVRPSGQTVQVEGMSDGTCDQLYLALRLALLESFLDGREPIPFIVDDVLIMFDDLRAAAALKALAELSKRTQVIFFTHHQHLVELAQNTQGINPCIHSLNTPAVSTPGG